MVKVVIVELDEWMNDGLLYLQLSPDFSLHQGSVTRLQPARFHSEP